VNFAKARLTASLPVALEAGRAFWQGSTPLRPRAIRIQARGTGRSPRSIRACSSRNRLWNVLEHGGCGARRGRKSSDRWIGRRPGASPAVL